MSLLTNHDNTNALMPHEDDAKAQSPQEVSSYTIQLSSNLNSPSALSPLETTLAQIEPHGAVVLFRFTSGEHTERFELSSAEIDALMATNRHRRLLINRFLDSAKSETDVSPS